MKRGSPARLLLRQAEGRPDEAWLTLKLLVYFFLMMAAAYLILPIKVSSFLKKLDVGLLPVAYIITAVLMSFVAAFNSRLLQRLNRRRYFSASLVFFIASLVVFWELFRLGGKWVAMAFWFWAEAFLAVSVIQFWILVNLLYRPRQVKRFIGLFVGAGLLGGIAGSAIASLLSKRLGSENLLLVCPALLAMALAILLGLPEGPPAAASEKPAETREARKRAAGYMESLRTILGSRYLVTLSTMILVAFCVSKIIDFQFGQALKLHFPADNQQDQQTAYQGAFLMFLLIGSYVFHVLVTGRLLKRFGLRTALFVAPVVLAVGAFSGLFVPAGALLVWASILRGVDKSLAVSINQSTREILYIPVPVETKVKAKVFIDLFVSKFADVLAAIICLICYWILKSGVQRLNIVSLAVIGIWLVFNVRIMREYLGIVKKNLNIKWPDADKLVLATIDVDTTKLVFDTIESRNRSSVLYAMNLMDLVHRDKLTPELKKIISEKSCELQAGGFNALLDVCGETLIPNWDDSLDDQTLGAEVREILSLDVYQELMRESVEKAVRSPGETGAVAQMEIAKAIGLMKPESPLVDNLAKLLRSGSRDVVPYALESAGRLKRREFVPLIVPYLARPDMEQAAARVLVDYGDRISGMLRDYLADAEDDVSVRRAIPMILAWMATGRTADFLVEELRRRDAAVRAEVIEALSKLRSMRPDLCFSPADIRPEIFELVRTACGLILEMAASKAEARVASPGDAEARLARTLKQTFELLGLLYSYEDVARAFQNFHEGSKTSVDFALELLENILEKEMKDVLLPLLEERPLDDKARACKRILKNML